MSNQARNNIRLGKSTLYLISEAVDGFLLSTELASDITHDFRLLLLLEVDVASQGPSQHNAKSILQRPNSNVMDASNRV
jgi:hypothetical protein